MIYNISKQIEQDIAGNSNFVSKWDYAKLLVTNLWELAVQNQRESKKNNTLLL